MLEKSIYISRREKLKKVGKKGIILIMGNFESPMDAPHNTYPFIQESTFRYFFGLNSPGLVGTIDIETGEEKIFGKEYTMNDIIWMGQQKTFKEQAKEVGIENFLEIDLLKKYIKNKKVLYTNQFRGENILFLSDLLDIKSSKINLKYSNKLVKLIIKLREIKSEEEIKQIEDSVNITRAMHLEAMKNVKPGMKEFELAAIVESVAKKYNSIPSFSTICTKNGAILHNHFYENELKDGDIVLLDTGARNSEGYCGDMTTVFPVSGKFSQKQKEIYELLIQMFEKAEEVTRDGITNKEVHLEVCKVLAKGLIDLNILKGDIDEIVRVGAHALFFPHGLGHMLGLDVHDMENFGEDKVGYDKKIKRSKIFGLKSLRMAKKLKVGHVLTIEPGIYFIPELIEKWEKENMHKNFINYEKAKSYIEIGGMRYEGDFLITSEGNRRLGEKMPKNPEEIEKLVNKNR